MSISLWAPGAIATLVFGSASPLLAAWRVRPRRGTQSWRSALRPGETYLMVCNFPAVTPGFIAGAWGTSMSIRAGKSLAGMGRPK